MLIFWVRLHKKLLGLSQNTIFLYFLSEINFNCAPMYLQCKKTHGVYSRSSWTAEIAGRGAGRQGKEGCTRKIWANPP